MTLRPFDPERLLEVLLRWKVRFVVIGGFAGRLFGSPSLTNDLDICYARDPKNLAALSSALLELGATLRGAPDGLPFRPDAPTLAAGDHFTFATDAGNLDCLGTPMGSGGYQDLVAGSTKMSVGTMAVSVVALEDLIRLKQASARPKDVAEMEILAALREEIDRSGSGR